MSEKDKKYMPQSTAGLIRYFDIEEGVKIKPEYVVYASVAFTALVVLLTVLG